MYDTKNIQKNWLYSFYLYYGVYIFIGFCNAFITYHEEGYRALYYVYHLIPPYVAYYFAYKKQGIMWLMWFTSIVPLCFLCAWIMEIKNVILTKSFINMNCLLLQNILCAYFLVNCYRLFLLNRETINQETYNRIVEKLWLIAFSSYCCALYCNFIITFKDAFNYDWDLILSIAPLFALFTWLVAYIPYYFSYKRRGTISIFVMMIFIPRPFLSSDPTGIVYKIIFAGLFIYLAISSYWLYKVNRARKSLIQSQIPVTSP